MYDIIFVSRYCTIKVPSLVLSSTITDKEAFSVVFDGGGGGVHNLEVRIVYWLWGRLRSKDFLCLRISVKGYYTIKVTSLVLSSTITKQNCLKLANVIHNNI